MTSLTELWFAIQEGTRRGAELQYKLALAQQYNDQPAPALGSVQAAIAILEKILGKLKAPAAGEQPAEASFGFGVPDPEELAKADAAKAAAAAEAAEKVRSSFRIS